MYISYEEFFAGACSLLGTGCLSICCCCFQTLAKWLSFLQLLQHCPKAGHGCVPCLPPHMHASLFAAFWKLILTFFFRFLFRTLKSILPLLFSVTLKDYNPVHCFSLFCFPSNSFHLALSNLRCLANSDCLF